MLKIAAIHEDCLPWEWTAQVYLRAIRLLGPRCVHTARWTVEALSQPANLQLADAAALEADILVVSVCATKQLPLTVNLWIDSWMPYRVKRLGLLVAMLGVAQQPSPVPVRILEYLRDVARLARLDFLHQELRLPQSCSGSATEGPLGSCLEAVNLRPAKNFRRLQ